MLALVIATLVIGWLLGGPRSGQRTAMGFSPGMRNVGVSLVIATASFPGTPAVNFGTGLRAVPRWRCLLSRGAAGQRLPVRAPRSALQTIPSESSREERLSCASGVRSGYSF